MMRNRIYNWQLISATRNSQLATATAIATSTSNSQLQPSQLATGKLPLATTTVPQLATATRNSTTPRLPGPVNGVWSPHLQLAIPTRNSQLQLQLQLQLATRNCNLTVVTRNSHFATCNYTYNSQPATRTCNPQLATATAIATATSNSQLQPSQLATGKLPLATTTVPQLATATRNSTTPRLTGPVNGVWSLDDLSCNK